ncbi:sugar transferase [Pseudaestuariivita rosea]|uniref:sugar transferase n=1 Tax=Pseudaestuariivita rosea TaxID=2763263 RepID=UPI001ABADDCF|nr:sugar transferase [Pseudaestuariivita rosea]
MTPQKRLFDLFISAAALVFFAPLLIAVIIWIVLTDGAPVFYGSERMKTPKKSFRLWKFRTMTLVDNDAGVSGGDKADRITKSGRLLRKYRLDELPQLWNVLMGDISLVGPRPPLAQYVEQFPALYLKVLQSRPGITGLATLVFHKREEKLLRVAKTAAETDKIYARRCVPVKARLDLIYGQHQSLCFDVLLLWRTVTKLLQRR